MLGVESRIGADDTRTCARLPSRTGTRIVSGADRDVLIETEDKLWVLIVFRKLNAVLAGSLSLALV